MEQSSNISLYDACEKCPLAVYIDITCDERLERLIISGDPSRELLEETREKLVQEFSELTGGSEMKTFIEATRRFFYLRNRITGMQIAIRLIAAGRYDEAVSYLNQSGIECAAPGNGEQARDLTAKLELKLKNLLGELRRAKKHYESLRGKGAKPTRQYYSRLLVMLSTCEAIKMQLDRNRLTLSELAEYINIFNEYHNQSKSIRDGRKH